MIVLQLTRIHQKQRLIIFHRAGILYKDLYDLSFYFTFNVIEEFHRFNDTYHFPRRNLITYIHKQGLIGA